MRDRIRSRGHFVMGPIDHGMCKSIYFAGPEGLQLELATGSGIDPAHWIDPEVVAVCGIEAADLRRYRAPAAFSSQGGAVPQPDPRARPTFVFPDEMRETAEALFAASDAEIAAALDHPEPPVPEPAATREALARSAGLSSWLSACSPAPCWPRRHTPGNLARLRASQAPSHSSAGEQALLETALGEAPIDRITLGPDGTVSLGACAAAAKIRPTKKQTRRDRAVDELRRAAPGAPGGIAALPILRHADSHGSRQGLQARADREPTPRACHDDDRDHDDVPQRRRRDDDDTAGRRRRDDDDAPQQRRDDDDAAGRRRHHDHPPRLRRHRSRPSS